MNKQCLYYVIFSLILVTGAASCSEGPIEESGVEKLVPGGERIPIPGIVYDEVYMYDQAWRNSHVTEGEETAPDHQSWQYFSLEAPQKGFKLFPAHHADLNVSLWYQIEGPKELPPDFYPHLTFVYYYKGIRVGAINVDYYLKVVWVQDIGVVTLSRKAMNRVMEIKHELRDHSS